MRAAGLTSERGPLVYAESVLLIRNHKAETIKRHIFRKQRMSSYYNAALFPGKYFMHAFFFCLTHGAAKKDYPYFQGLKQF